ncbi:copper amine oxidase domain protein [Candidatus Desulforudis audaxviator MP104C]|uniref:Copper amine oxidase domain protein n=2 Tax=Candidatus Desulforudis TaxID=471826 RepID=B1I2L9_DESAP|nr:copper amine oxidase domain protein [Candidatus Desulforudis audaxviator MP104C]
MMKRSIFVTATTLLLTVTVLFAAPPYRQAGAGSPEIIVLLDGLPVHFDVPPQIINGRTLVPFRLIAEALNISVSWDGTTRTVSASEGGKQVILQIDNNTGIVNGSAIILDTAPVIIDSRTLIPLRFFSETFGCRVEWAGETRTIKIASPPCSMNVIGFYALGDARTSSWTNLFGVPFPATGIGNTDIVRELALGWYTIDAEGNLLTRSPRTAWQRPAGWETVLATAREFGFRTEMVIHETNRGGLLTAFLNDEQAMSRAVDAIVQEASLFDGVNLNLEELGPYATGETQQKIRDSFTNFVALLSPPLREASKTITLTIHPPNSSFRGYDYQALSQLADRIIVMAHDYGPKPEPLNRVVQAVEMALTVVPREKLVLAISAPSETAESITAKVGIAKRYRLQGVSLWRLGLVTEGMWASLRQTIKTRR